MRTSLRTRFTPILGAVLAMSLVLGMLPANAGIVSSFSDALSVHTTSASANHTFTFVTPTGVNASTDTILLTFSSGFTLTPLVSPGDFDLAVGSTGVCSSAVFTDKTVAAVAAAGVWGVATSGQQVTFTAPTDAVLGEITAGRCVTIEIGTNATFGTTGTNQITNPSSAGSKTIWLSGTFADSGELAVAITSPGQVTVDATVTAAAPGGGGGGGPGSPPPDTTPPIISNVRVPVVGPTNVEVAWDTDELANSEVDYGLTTGYEIGSVSNGSFVFSRSIPIGGLTSGTTYHYRVRSADASGNSSTSNDFTFATLVVPDNDPPIISGINVTNITGNSASIGWVTDEGSDSTVDYGLSVSYGLTATDATRVTTHFLNLTGLAQLTTYHFKVTSVDAATNSASSSDLTFTTIDDTPPLITGPNIGSITDTSVNVTWSTDESATGLFEYGTTPSYGTNLTTPSATSNSVPIFGLTQSTTYFYRLTATDSSSNSSQVTGSFDTLADTNPPGAVSNLTVTPGDSQNTLSWTNPTDPDFKEVVIRRKTTSFPSNAADGVEVYRGSGSSFVNTGLTNGTRYYYGAFSLDTHGNYGAGALEDGTPMAPTIPPSCGDGICNGSETNAICPNDCPTTTLPVCGDNICNGTETNAICPNDCPLGPVCGDTVCDVGESNQSCPSDCSVTAGRDMNGLNGSDIEIILRSRGVNIQPAPDGSFKLLTGTEVLVRIPDSALAGTVRDAMLTIGNDQYRMFRGGSYDAIVTLPNSQGQVVANVTVNYQDGNYDDAAFVLNLVGPGEVYEMVGATKTPIAGATVTLYGYSGGKHVIETATTDGAGHFSFLVVPDTYSVKVDVSGYGPKETPQALEYSLVNPSIELTKIVSIEEILNSDTPLSDKLGALLDQAGIGVDQLRNNPDVQQGSNQVAPAAATIAVVNAITVISVGAIANAGAWFQYLFFQPLLWFSRRKRKGWGIVYDSLTKLPIDLAVVRLADAATGRLIQSRVTDRQGRYFFIVDPGRYRIMVAKPGFTFPSEFMKGEKEDVKYTEVYHMEDIEVTEAGSTIAANIPVDPIGKALVPAKDVVFKAFFRRVQLALAVVGVIAGTVAAYLNPTMFTIGLLVLQFVLFFGFRAIAKGKKPKGWGIVYDQSTKLPLANAVVRIFEPKYNKLLDTYVTDARGRYSFIVGPNVYYTTYERTGYAPHRQDNLDYTRSGESAIVNVNVPLSQHGQSSTPVSASPPPPPIAPSPNPFDSMKNPAA